MKTMNGGWRLESNPRLKLQTTTPLERIRPRGLLKLIASLELRKVCGTDDISNESHNHLPRRPLVHLTNLD
jgi:hypothetical protein